MPRIVSAQSDAGLIALYDPSLLRARVKAPSSWWSSAPFGTPERAAGHLAIWPLGGGRAATRPHRLRLGDALDPGEALFACGRSEAAPLRVEGEELFLGPAERLPGDGAGDRLPALPDGGGLYPAPAPGRYTAVVHVLDWKSEGRFWTEDNEPTPDAPPDFVVVLTPCEEPVAAEPEPTPLLDLLPKKTPTASKKVSFATRPPPRSSEPERPRRSRRARPKASAEPSRLARKQERIMVRALEPGQLGVGARVRHAVYGIGEVRFMREGFPKVKVHFPGHGFQKVDKDELSLL